MTSAPIWSVSAATRCERAILSDALFSDSVPWKSLALCDDAMSYNAWRKSPSAMQAHRVKLTIHSGKASPWYPRTQKRLTTNFHWRRSQNQNCKNSLIVIFFLYMGQGNWSFTQVKLDVWSDEFSALMDYLNPLSMLIFKDQIVIYSLILLCT